MEFREYEQKDVKKIIELVREELKVPNFDEEFWKWKFERGNPCGKTLGFVAEDDKKTIGFCSFFPYKVKVGEKFGKCYLVADVVVNKYHRGKGIFKNMYKEALEQIEKLEDIIGTYLFSSSMAYRAYTDRFSYRSLGKLKYFVAVGNISFLAKRKLGRFLGGNIGKIGETFLHRDIKWIEDKYDFAEIKRFDKDFDEFWERVKERWYIAIERTSKFLNWRYFGHPWNEYTIFSCYKRGELRGYIVLKIPNIMDIVFMEIEDGLALISKGMKWFVEKGVPIVNLLIFGSEEEYEVLKRAGFLFYNYKIRPFGLYPAQELLVRPSHNIAYSQKCFNSGKWKFSLSDIDCGI